LNLCLALLEFLGRRLVALQSRSVGFQQLLQARDESLAGLDTFSHRTLGIRECLEETVQSSRVHRGGGDSRVGVCLLVILLLCGSSRPFQRTAKLGYLLMSRHERCELARDRRASPKGRT